MASNPLLRFLQAMSAILVAVDGAHGGERLAGPVTAEIVRIIDGDTVAVRARVWIDLELAVSVRIRGIDAPERAGACPREKDMAKVATDFLVATAGPDTVILSNIAEDKFSGRVVADVASADGESLAARMLASGLVRVYQGGKRQGWCDLVELAD